ncbi:hypothetical protein K438DRAFT_2021103 [Mycena galopus ATCC 62051]|nr:hypothetical protein K438DRAFT_2021103 [Mycena galopus ATCC 62051]
MSRSLLLVSLALSLLSAPSARLPPRPGTLCSCMDGTAGNDCRISLSAANLLPNPNFNHPSSQTSITRISRENSQRSRQPALAPVRQSDDVRYPFEQQWRTEKRKTHGPAARADCAESAARREWPAAWCAWARGTPFGKEETQRGEHQCGGADAGSAGTSTMAARERRGHGGTHRGDPTAPDFKPAEPAHRFCCFTDRSARAFSLLALFSILLQSMEKARFLITGGLFLAVLLAGFCAKARPLVAWAPFLFSLLVVFVGLGSVRGGGLLSPTCPPRH